MTDLDRALEAYAQAERALRNRGPGEATRARKRFEKANAAVLAAESAEKKAQRQAIQDRQTGERA